jgi:hypothetical protein
MNGENPCAVGLSLYLAPMDKKVPFAQMRLKSNTCMLIFIHFAVMSLQVSFK